MKLRFLILAAVLLAPTLMVGCGSDGTAGGTSPDTTPPLAPVVLGARGDVDVLGVWWSPNNEPDLRGYHVYMSSAGVVRRVNTRTLTESHYSCQVPSEGTVTVFVTAVDLSGNESSPSAMRTVTFQTDDQIEGFNGQKRVMDGQN